jgi:hypothetical protein
MQLLSERGTQVLFLLVGPTLFARLSVDFRAGHLKSRPAVAGRQRKFGKSNS